MSKVALNPIFRDVRGAFDGLMVKRWRGRPYLCRRPDYSQMVASPAQRKNRETFGEAGTWAGAALADPELRAFYEELYNSRKYKRKSLASIPTADYRKPPVVSSIDLKEYTGHAGDPIRVRAHDNVGVHYVEVIISYREDEVVECGMAAEETPGTNWWLYIATENAEPGSHPTITAIAYDRPGNSASRTAILAKPVAT